MFTRFIALYLLTTSLVYAQTLTISLAELDQAMDEATIGGNSLRQFTLTKLRQELAKLDISWRDGQFQQNLYVADRELDGGCVYTADMRDFDGIVSVKNNTSVELSLTSLNEPFSLGFDLQSNFDASAHIDQTYAIRLLKKCYKYAQDGFNVDVDGTLNLRIKITVSPTYQVTDSGLLFTPHIEVSSNLDQFKYKLNVSNTILKAPLESLIRDAIDEEISNKKLSKYAERLESSLIDSVNKSWGGQSLNIVLPELDDKAISKLLGILDLPLFSDLGEALIRNHLPELFYALLTNNSAVSTSLVSSVAICELLHGQTVDLQTSPLYKRVGDRCVVDTNIHQSDEKFTDSACVASVSYIAEQPIEYCEELMNPTLLGNAAASRESLGKWTLSDSTRLNVGVRSLVGNQQPYMSRVNFRSIDSRTEETGQCELEMRIFKRDIGATGLKPLLAFHGGSWTFRRSGVIGLEAQTSHLTDLGFVVFEPFYRLTGDDEANSECHNATGEQIIQDAEAALDWVLQNAAQYGAESATVAVTGQSAGAHLAGWLMVHRSPDVSRGLLLYPPTDFGHFIKQYQAGAQNTETQGLSAIKRFIGKPVEEVGLDEKFIVQNSFPGIIAKQPAVYPPAFIVHGSGDTLVPVDQATRLCGAYNGAPDSIVVSEQPDHWRQVEACGDQGELHIIEGAEHALDVCLFDSWCLAGKSDAQKAAGDALNLGSHWLIQ